MQILPMMTMPEQLESSSAQERYRAARLLEQAADFPDDQWTQGAKARSPNGNGMTFHPGKIPESSPLYPSRFCALGHIERVTGCLSHKPDLPTALLREAVTREIQEPIPDWNDAPGRTAAEVRRLFQQAANRLYREAAAQGLQAAEPAAPTPAAAGPCRIPAQKAAPPKPALTPAASG